MPPYGPMYTYKALTPRPLKSVSQLYTNAFLSRDI